MPDNPTKQGAWLSKLRHQRTTLVVTVVAAVIAFALGAFLFAGGDANRSSVGGAGDSHQAVSEATAPELWTCSMHPQIQLPKPGNCPICFMDLIPVESGGGEELDASQVRMSETAMQLAGIQTTPVTRAFATREIRMVGKLDYDETRVSYITAWVPGRLDSLYVDYTGVRIARGESMVRLYSPELIAAQEELRQAKQAVQSVAASSNNLLQSTARQTLQSAREKLQLFGLSEEQIGRIETSERTSDFLTITAPQGGIVVHKDAKEGMYVSTGTRIYTIADLSHLWAVFEAYESDLPWLKVGQQVAFSSPSFPGEQFEAEISFIDPTVDPKTRTVEVRAIVRNTDRRLKPEMFVRAEVDSRIDGSGAIFNERQMTAGDADSAPLLIPASAPLLTGKRAVVYVQMPSDDGVVFEGREISLGPRAGDYYVVESGLEEGESVVTNGAFKIDSELQILAKPSMMSPPERSFAGHDHGDIGTGPIHTGAADDASIDAVYTAGSATPITAGENVLTALTPVYDDYFKVQMSLANDDLGAAGSAFAALESSVADVDMTLFEGDAHMRWMKLSDAIKTAASHGAEAGTIVGARDAFFHLSQAVIELHDTFGHAADQSYYLTFCPMARDNAGAYWLQTENIVWNSFYGDMMLRCGEIRKELPPTASTSE